MRNKNKLKILLIEKNVKQIQLAHDLNLHNSQLSLMVNGWRKIPDQLKSRLAAYLGISEEKLFGDDRNNEKESRN